MTTAFSGFALGASLIIAIGAQNAFVLRQGLRRDGVWLAAGLCTLCDWALIAAGAAGFGALVSASPAVTRVAAWGGSAYLLVHGALAFRSAIEPRTFKREDRTRPVTALVPLALSTLAVSLLNPHVYLDTVVLLGSVAAQYPMPDRAVFAAGAAGASAVWFFSLGYGARLFAPLFEKPAAWRMLDVAIGLIMWWVAFALALGRIGR